VGFTTHPHLVPRLKKELSYTSASPLGLRGLLQGELYLYAHVSIFNISGEEVKPEYAILQWISEFQQHGKSTQQHGNILDILSTKNNKIVDGIICTACLSMVKSLIQYRKNHTAQEFREFLRKICVDLRIQKEGVCAGLIDVHLVNEFHSYNKNVLLHR
jgi:hypothetical protein